MMEITSQLPAESISELQKLYISEQTDNLISVPEFAFCENFIWSKRAAWHHGDGFVWPHGKQTCALVLSGCADADLLLNFHHPPTWLQQNFSASPRNEKPHESMEARRVVVVLCQAHSTQLKRTGVSDRSAPARPCRQQTTSQTRKQFWYRTNVRDVNDRQVRVTGFLRRKTKVSAAKPGLRW